MKKLIFALAIIGTCSCSTPSNHIENNSEKRSETYGSILYGTYTWGDSTKLKKTSAKEELLKKNKNFLDTSKYETKKILGGAIKWTTKKITTN